MVVGLERERERVASSRKRSTARADTSSTTESELTPTVTADSEAVTREDISLRSKVHDALRPVARGAVSPCYLPIQLTVSDTTASLNGVATLIDELKCTDITERVFPSHVLFHSEYSSLWSGCEGVCGRTALLWRLSCSCTGAVCQSGTPRYPGTGPSWLLLP